MLYIVGWVRFFCEAKKRNPTKQRQSCYMYVFIVGLRFFATQKNLTQPTV